MPQRAKPAAYPQKLGSRYQVRNASDFSTALATTSHFRESVSASAPEGTSATKPTNDQMENSVASSTGVIPFSPIRMA